ncbi:MAG: glycosyltransferase [Candidatus Competibacteraceae bacterium]
MNQILHILYIGSLWQGSTCLMRMRALEKLGHKLLPVDTEPHQINKRGVRLADRVMSKLGYPIDIWKINQKLEAAVEQYRPDIVWIDKGLVIWPDTLRAIKRLNSKTIIIGYSPDDMVQRHSQSRYWLNGLHLYDVYFTTKTYNVAELRAMGAKCPIFVGNAFDPETHRPISITQEERIALGSPVGFIGAWEYDRAEKMLALASSGVKVRAWGWQSRSSWVNRHPNLIVESKLLWSDDYAKAICSSDIALCFLRKINRDRQTTRSIEIPACGTFMLAERTDEHLELFAEGKEAEFFSSTAELIDKTRFYLQHDNLRKKIAAAGRERCIRSGYDYPSRIRWMLTKVREKIDLNSEMV